MNLTELNIVPELNLQTSGFAETESLEAPHSMEAAQCLIAAERDRLLVEHLPTVRYIARSIHERLPQHVEMEDLVSAGILGLIDAFSKFDGGKQVKFKSYAQFRVRGAILDSLRELDWGPRELRRKGREVEQASRKATQKLGRAPEDTDIAAEMGVPLAEYQHILAELKGLEIGSLHTERGEDSGDEELAYVPTAPEEDPLFQCLQGEMRQRLIDAIDALPEKERIVLTLYYYEELALKEIGLTLGVVESRVSQIRSAAVARLRTVLAGPATVLPDGRGPLVSGPLVSEQYASEPHVSERRPMGSVRSMAAIRPSRSAA